MGNKEKQVLVQMPVGADGNVRVAPGVEVPLASFDRVYDLPPEPEVMVAVLGFACDKTRKLFEEEFDLWLNQDE